jgi:hypothetical protein
MSLTTRAMGALAVLSLAAIPVTALSIQSASWDDTSATGESRVAAGASSDEDRDCNPDCAVAEAPHASRLLSQAITPDTEMGSLANVAHTPEPHGLVPQNPGATAVRAEEPSRIETSSTNAEPVSAPPRKRVYKRKKVSKTTAGAGSFQLLFEGPGK